MLANTLAVVETQHDTAEPIDLGLGAFEPNLQNQQLIVIQSQQHRSFMKRCFEGREDVVVYLDGTHNATKYKMEMVRSWVAYDSGSARPLTSRMETGAPSLLCQT